MKSPQLCAQLESSHRQRRIFDCSYARSSRFKSAARIRKLRSLVCVTRRFLLRVRASAIENYRGFANTRFRTGKFPPDIPRHQRAASHRPPDNVVGYDFVTNGIVRPIIQFCHSSQSYTMRANGCANFFFLSTSATKSLRDLEMPRIWSDQRQAEMVRSQGFRTLVILR